MTGNKMILIGMHLIKEACGINFQTTYSPCDKCPLRIKCDIMFAGNNAIPFGFQFDEDENE